MNTYRKSAITVGLLFLIALILNPIATEIFDPILNTPDYLEKAYAGRNFIIIGNLLNFICAIAMIFIPISLFPVVRKNNESLASSYIVFRALEGILFIYIAIKSLSFINLSKVYINEATQNASYLQSLGSSIHSEIYWATIIYIIIYALGGVTFYYLLYKSKLVPRFLSIWGLMAVVLLFVGAILGLFSLGIFNRLPLMKAMVYFAPPIAINEFVLALWLIIKGYNSPAMDFNASKTDNKL
jgi:hypothetical protein